MTETRDFDRLARAWLDLMPDESPDRVIDAVLQAVETTPQLRRPIGAVVRRSFQMNRFSLAAVAVGIVVVVAGGAIVLGRFTSSSSVGGPSSSPTSTPRSNPSSTPGSADGPAPLLGRWLGATRTAVSPGGGGADLLFSSFDLVVTQGNASGISNVSSAAQIVDGKLRLTLGSGCAASDQGTYSWSLSSSGQTLTIQAVSDPCAQRLGAVSGTWWRMDCHADGDFCLGLLDPGTYGSRAFVAFQDKGQIGRYGALTFTVPEGWANDGDWPGNYTLWPAADYAATTTDNPDPAAQLEVMANVSPESQSRPCSDEIQSGVAHTPAAFLTWLRGIAGLQVSPSTQLTVDGHPAMAVDLSVPVAPTATCNGGAAVVEYLVSDGWNGDLITNGILAGERQRLIVFQVNGVLTAIVIHVHDASRFDAFVQQAMPLVETFRFQ